MNTRSVKVGKANELVDFSVAGQELDAMVAGYVRWARQNVWRATRCAVGETMVPPRARTAGSGNESSVTTGRPRAARKGARPMALA